MSQTSWSDEFYPVRADRVEKDDAVAHSLQKWRGLLPANLIKHDIKQEPIEVDGSTCALCVIYHKENYDEEHVPIGGLCATCPIVAVRGRACDKGLAGERRAPYHDWINYRNPQPMIDLLERCLKHESTSKGD